MKKKKRIMNKIIDNGYARQERDRMARERTQQYWDTSERNIDKQIREIEEARNGSVSNSK